LRKLIDDLIDRVSGIALPRIRLSEARVRGVVASLVDRLTRALVPRIRRSLATTRKATELLVDRVRQTWLPRSRLSLERSRDAIRILVDRLTHALGPRTRRSLPRLSVPIAALIAGLAERVHGMRLPRGRPAQEQLRTVSDAVPNRLEALRWRLRISRLGRSADGIIVLPLLGAVLVLGVFTATAATHRSPDGAQSDVTPARTGSDVDVVTETKRHVVTVTRAAKEKMVTVEQTRVRNRVVKRPGGVSTVLESVAAPSQTKTVAGPTETVAGPTKTVTVTGPTDTVTQVVTETVTTAVTVTETVKHPHP
jgi:hypothetical protein